jgi:hypothetical protein
VAGMSICIDVVPSCERIPTIKELSNEIAKVIASLSSDERNLYYWREAGVKIDEVLIEFVGNASSSEARFTDPSAFLSMDGYNYGWLSMDGYKVGFDFYYIIDDDYFMQEYMAEEIIAKSKGDELSEYFSLEKAATIQHSWMMRGVVGRSPATWLLAGISAAALAKLTDGLLFSDDGGADYSRLPCDPDTFLQWFPAWCRSQWGNAEIKSSSSLEDDHKDDPVALMLIATARRLSEHGFGITLYAPRNDYGIRHANSLFTVENNYWEIRQSRGPGKCNISNSFNRTAKGKTGNKMAQCNRLVIDVSWHQNNSAGLELSELEQRTKDELHRRNDFLEGLLVGDDYLRSFMK